MSWNVSALLSSKNPYLIARCSHVEACKSNKCTTDNPNKRNQFISPCLMPFSLIFTYLLIFLVKTEAARYSYQTSTTAPFANSLLTDFGMAYGGKIQIQYDITNTPYPYENNIQRHLVFVVVTDTQRQGWYSSLNGNPTNYCELPSQARYVVQGSDSDEFQFDVIALRKYSVIMLQCWQPTYYSSINKPTFKISVDVTATNAVPNSKQRAHLGIQKVMTVRVLVFEMALYGLLLIAFINLLLTSRLETIFVAHFFFFICLILSTMKSVASYINMDGYNRSGVTNQGHQNAMDAISAILGVAFTYNVLIVALGWTFIRAEMSSREWAFIICTFPIYLLSSLVSVACNGDSSVLDANACTSAALVNYVLNIVLILATVVGVNVIVAFARAMLMSLPWGPSVPMQYVNLKRYRRFRVIYFVYLLAPTCYELMQQTMFTWEYDWIFSMLNDFTDICFIFFMGANFSPFDPAMLTRSFDGSLEEDT